MQAMKNVLKQCRLIDPSVMLILSPKTFGGSGHSKGSLFRGTKAP